MPQYVEKDFLLPLDNYIENLSDLEDILPIYREMYMEYDGHKYGMVYDGDAHLLFYRKDLFEKYNDEYYALYGYDLHPPKNWEEHDRISEFLTKDLTGDGQTDLYGTAILGGDGMRYIWFLERYLSMGGNYFDEEMKPLINNEIGIHVLQSLIDLI